MSCRRTLHVALLASLLLQGGLTSTTLAEPSASAVKEAGKHFQRGVSLYNEADYRAALVEFKRAYQIAPNAAVLYNIGQTYFQLQNYAAALNTLDRYLTESGAAAAHRREVETTMETLQARVGKVLITTSVPDCEITVDDELVGRSPLSEPVLVSIGHRKIVVTRDGRQPETRYVDVAAGDTVPLSISLGESTGPTKPVAATTTPSSSSSRSYVTPAWVVTGALGAGALTTGVLAFLASRDLKDARDSFPVTKDDLNSKSSKVKTLSLTADILGAATLIAGGIALKLTLSQSSTHEVHVAVVPNGIQVAGTFR
jgi:hypothetical protein